jgi:hypothetical protein
VPKGKHSNHARGSSHPRWNKEKIISSDGYTKIRVGVSHPLSDPNGYAYEHLLVWVSSGKQPPGEGEIIHHYNDDKSDNRIGNLILMTRAEHNELHNKEKGRNKLGQFVGKKAAGAMLDGREWREMPTKEG